jgi:hypothetical protein
LVEHKKYKQGKQKVQQAITLARGGPPFYRIVPETLNYIEHVKYA